MDSSTLLKLVVPIAAGGALLLWYLGRNGMLTRLNIHERVLGPFLVLHKRHIGEYRGVGKVFDEAFSTAPKYGIAAARGFGVYFDDPNDTPAEHCRALCGSIVELPRASGASEEDVIAGVKSGIKQLPPGFELGIFPASRCLVVDFPFYGILSIMFCIMRVYPKLKQALGNVCTDEVGCGGSVEIYDARNHVMHVAWPLTARDDLMPFDLPPGLESKASKDGKDD